MAGTWTTERYPEFAEQVKALTQQHRELDDEPLRLALSYSPGRNSDDIFLLEVVDNFARNEVAEDKQLFEVCFGSSSEFTLPGDSQLHLVLTNPTELRFALEQHWPSVEEIRRAVQLGDFAEEYSDDDGKKMLELLRE